jgi:hypothetical protein
MNRYVDKRIAFCYPDDLRCTCHRNPHQYYLRRGTLHIFLEIPDQEDWECLFHDAGRVRQVPPGSVDERGQPIPTLDQWFEEYAQHGFRGRAKSTLTRTRFGEISGKHVDLVLKRGRWRIWLQINDSKDFPLDRVPPILETLAFPGESAYLESRRQGPNKKQSSSPYVVSLKHFPALGRKGRKGRARFDVEYRGDPPSDHQLQAVERFLDDEEALYEQAKIAILRYYTERVYPFVSKFGPYDALWPACRTVEDAMRLVKLSSLMVHEPREDGAVPIGLRFYCSWDEEHGMGLRAVGSTIEAVGTDFVALDSRQDEWPEFRKTRG